jgi:hypothetical protein
LTNPNVIKVLTRGQRGLPGADGTDGVDGADGADGADGTAGTAAYEDHGTVVSGTVTLDRGSTNVAVHRVVVGANITISTDGWPATGTYGELLVEQANGGAYTVAFADTITWLTVDSSVPEFQASGTDFYVLFSHDGGTTIYGAPITDFSAASLTDENQALSGGVTVTEKDLGTVSSGTTTLDMGDRPMHKYTNGGAHTLNPGAVIGTTLIAITNNASAGAITTAGWTKVAGDSFTTTNGHKFLCSASVSAVGSLLTVQAMQ